MCPTTDPDLIPIARPIPERQSTPGSGGGSKEHPAHPVVLRDPQRDRSCRAFVEVAPLGPNAIGVATSAVIGLDVITCWIEAAELSLRNGPSRAKRHRGMLLVLL